MTEPIWPISVAIFLFWSMLVSLRNYAAAVEKPGLMPHSVTISYLLLLGSRETTIISFSAYTSLDTAIEYSATLQTYRNHASHKEAKHGYYSEEVAIDTSEVV
jgi:hypothetical protein